MHDDPPFAVKLMVDWFYNFEYTLTVDEVKLWTSDASSTTQSLTEIDSWMFTLADKYDVPNLKNFALSQARGVLLLKEPDHFMSFATASLLSATAHAFKNAPPTDNQLCTALVEAWLADDKRLLRHVKKGDLESVMAEVPEFASALIAEQGGFVLKADDEDAA